LILNHLTNFDWLQSTLWSLNLSHPFGDFLPDKVENLSDLVMLKSSAVKWAPPPPLSMLIRNELEIRYDALPWMNIADDRKDETLADLEMVPVPKGTERRFALRGSFPIPTVGDMTDEVY